MSDNFQKYKYQTSTLRNHSYNPKIVTSYNSSTVKVGHSSQNKPTLISLNGKGTNLNTFKSVNLISSIMNYIYQDDCPDSNVIFFDSNLHKYRIDSLGRKQILSRDSLSKLSEKKTYSSNTFSKSFNDTDKYKPKKTLNLSSIQTGSNTRYGNENNLSSKYQSKTLTGRNALQPGQKDKIQLTSTYQVPNKNLISSQNKSASVVSGRTHTISSYGNKINQSQNAISGQNKALIEKMNKSQDHKVNYTQNISSSNRGQTNIENKRVSDSMNKNNKSQGGQVPGRVDILKKVDVNKESKTTDVKPNQNQNRRANQPENKDNKQTSTVNKSNYNTSTPGTKVQQPTPNLRDAKTILSNAKEIANKKDAKAPVPNTKQSINQKETTTRAEQPNTRQSNVQKESTTKPTLSNSKPNQLTNKKEDNTKGTASKQNIPKNESNDRQNQSTTNQKDQKQKEPPATLLSGKEKLIKDTKMKESQKISQQQQIEDNRAPKIENKPSNSVNRSLNKNMSLEKEDKNQQFQQQQRQTGGRGLSQNSQIKKSVNNQENTNIRPTKQNENLDQNVEIVNKHEEKTIVVLPGQTIEPKTITETFQNPIVETVENEDGTTSSVIKQTKITTISENVPIGTDKIRAIDGAPDLPMVKQYITYEYKTVMSPKDGKIDTNQILKSQNKVFEEDKLYAEDQQGQGQRVNGERGHYDEELNEQNKIDRNKDGNEEEMYANNLEENEMGLYGSNKPENLKYGTKGGEGGVRGSRGENPKSKKIGENQKGSLEAEENDADADGDIKGKSLKSKGVKKGNKKGGKNEEELMSGAKLGTNQEKNKKGNQINDAIASVDDNFKGTSKQLAEGVATTKEEKLIAQIINKGDNATKEEKQKQSKFLLDLYGKCCLEGEKAGSEENLEKLSQFLAALGEKDKKEILAKLSSNFPQKGEIFKKLVGLMSKNSKSGNAQGGRKGGKNLSGSMKEKSGKKAESVKFDDEFSKGLQFGKTSLKHEHGGKGGISSALLDSKLSENIEIKDVAPLKFDGLFLEIKEYDNGHKEKNPFEGPSPFDKFYRARKAKIKKKIISMGTEENKEDEKKI